MFSVSIDNFNDFVVEVNLVVDAKMRGMCKLPYPNHPRGCTNFHRRDDCPPKAPVIYETLNLMEPVYAIFNVFDFAFHVKKMRDKHPKWSDRQVQCCLYLQPKARKYLREKIKIFKSKFPDLAIISTPEAQGVNLTATTCNAGIDLEWPPETVTYQIVLAGVPLKTF